MSSPASLSSLLPSSPTSPSLSPLEHDLLEEYELLADNMKRLANIIDEMAASPTSEMIEGLRMLERKTSLVFTLLKASVYGIVLQQECFGEGEG